MHKGKHVCSGYLLRLSSELILKLLSQYDSLITYDVLNYQFYLYIRIGYKGCVQICPFFDIT